MIRHSIMGVPSREKGLDLSGGDVGYDDTA